MKSTILLFIASCGAAAFSFGMDTYVRAWSKNWLGFWFRLFETKPPASCRAGFKNGLLKHKWEQFWLVLLLIWGQSASGHPEQAEKKGWRLQGFTKALLYWEALAAVNWKLWEVTVVREPLPAYRRAHGSQAAWHTDTLQRDFSKI